MKYERLTGKSECGYNNLDACLNCDLEMDCGLCPDWGKALDRLAELEDNMENGTLIELPCKIGDTIWVVDESWGHREDGTWGSTSEMHEGKVYSFTYYGACLHVEDDFTSNCYLWGEDAFPTREEAEKRLSELQGDKE